MNNEYVIINKTEILKRIEEWEAELQECFKAPVGEFNHDYVSTLQQAIATSREILSQSTPLIPEIEKAFDAGRTVKNYKGEWQETYSDVMTSAKYQESKDYISNLKLDI